ncbi:MAG: ABC transporter substrate-binding protein [Anaerolineae bacterium]|jgi:peptide/nickel transport system substrate-binding protein
MRKVSVVLGVLVALAMVVGLAACATEAPPEPTAAPPEPTEAAAAPTEAPPTEVPPTEVPPTEVPPTEVPPTEAPPAPTELRIGISLDVESMDPFFVNQAAGWSVVHALFDHLVERDFEGNIVPGLALSWTIVDTSTLEFELRQDVSFHNGEPFNAESVKFSVERMLAEEEAPNQGKFTSIDSVEIMDDYTVRLHLNRPDGTLFDSLTSRLAMLPPQYFEEVGAEGFAQAPVGTGPFSFVEWVPDDHVTLVANEDYWEGSYKGQPQVDTVIFRPIPEAATRVAELEAGGVHMIQDVLPDQMDELEAAGLTVVPDEAFQLQYVFFITDDESLPTHDVRVRQALNYAVDVEAIIENLLAGLGSHIASPIGPGYLGYNPDVEPYPYDPDMARELLADAGYADGFETTLDVTTAGHTDIVDAVAGYLAEVGVDVTIQDYELGQFNQNWMDRAQSMLWAARWGNTPDPQSIELFASCNGWITRYCNEEVTTHLEAARDTLDQDERAEHYAAASELMHEDPLAIYLNTAAQIYGLDAGVENFQPSPLLAIIVSGVSVSE